MAGSNGNGVWKWATGLMGSAMLTGVVAWFSFGGGISRADARTLFREHDKHPHPGAVSRDEFEMIIDRLDRIEAKLDRGQP